ncbi:hypothetical protein B0I35DRAFT_490140 [Stachybotrys elegans]|uniref:Uncharacterized protein n=1 Tax=Stachybotrys elegans TaxID=80388 RepID=A0A8K0SHR5_9HYPO|nr:hypothetical protein B0I35DRAFT_490140 [Stachybotrys elegans]
MTTIKLPSIENKVANVRLEGQTIFYREYIIHPALPVCSSGWTCSPASRRIYRVIYPVKFSFCPYCIMLPTPPSSRSSSIADQDPSYLLPPSPSPTSISSTEGQDQSSVSPPTSDRSLLSHSTIPSRPVESFEFSHLVEANPSSLSSDQHAPNQPSLPLLSPPSTQETSAPEPKRNLSFSDLPPEIRNTIYNMALVQKNPIVPEFTDLTSPRAQRGEGPRCVRRAQFDPDDDRFSPSTHGKEADAARKRSAIGLLGVSKAIRREAQSVFYGRNSFRFEIDDSKPHMKEDVEYMLSFMAKIGRENVMNLACVTFHHYWIASYVYIHCKRFKFHSTTFTPEAQEGNFVHWMECKGEKSDQSSNNRGPLTMEESCASATMFIETRSTDPSSRGWVLQGMRYGWTSVGGIIESRMMYALKI